MEKTITHCYDNASYFSREALYELQIVYLSAEEQSGYVIAGLNMMHFYLDVLIKNRLVKGMAEELRMKN